MVKLESFDLILDRFDKQIYSAGDYVSGCLYLTVSAKHPVKINDLSVNLCGESKTSWVNKVSDNIYDSTEPYLNLKQTFKNLLDSYAGSPGNVLPGGQHRFPFKFHLPATLPSSYEGEFGYIRYTLTAEINAASGGAGGQRAASFRAGFSSRHKKMAIEKSLLISAQVGLDQLSLSTTIAAHQNQPNLSSENEYHRQEGTYESSGCCGLFGSGRLNASIGLQKSAFLLGQTIALEIWIQNTMRRTIRSPAIVSLVQDVHFRSISFFQTASDSKTVSKIFDAIQTEIPERGKESTKLVYMTIRPDLPATSVQESLISIRYKLKLEIGHFELVLPIGLATKL